MSAGKYNRLVTIQQLTPGQDPLGQPVQSWSDVCAPWAWLRNPAGSSAIKASADVSTVQTSIRIRWRTTPITSGMRVVLGAVVYDINAVLPDLEGHRHIDLVCTTGASNG